MSKVIVTGGVGFIGSHLSRALLLAGHRVVIIDDFSDAPYPRASKEENQRDLEKEFGEKVSVQRISVTDVEAMRPHFEGAETVFHLAGLAGVRPSFLDPARYARVNVEGTANVFELADACKATKLLFASSSSVYGNSTPLPASEASPCISPESPYAASKRGAELVTLALARRAVGLACVGLRFFTVYGPKQRPEMAISSFTRAALAGEEVTLFGDGSMRRDFTHVDDIVRGILAIHAHAKPGFDVFNLGSGAPVDLTTMISGIENATGKTLRYKVAPVPLGDVDATFADVSKAKELAGWAPQMKLEDGLKTVADWLRARS